MIPASPAWLARAAGIAAAMIGCALAPIEVERGHADTRRVTLVSMNDLHSHATSFPAIAGFIAAYRAVPAGQPLPPTSRSAGPLICSATRRATRIAR